MQHILATSSTTGYTVVWDLKSKREVLTLSYPGASVGGGSMGNLGQMGASRRGITAIAWNPDVVCVILTGCSSLLFLSCDSVVTDIPN